MKNVKIITIILAIVLVTLVAFGGVYLKTQNRMENKVKEYDLSRELKGERRLEVKVTTGEETTNTSENLTIENYKTVKKTIEKRLENLGAQDYTMSLNEEDGTIIVELPEDENTDLYAYFLTADGKAKITEKDTDTELVSDSMIEKATYSYTSNIDGEYLVYMELKLTEEGQAKIEELQNEYAFLANEIEEIEIAQEAEEELTETEETTEGEDGENDVEETESQETTTEEMKKIAVLTMAGSEYDIDKIEKNKIRVKIGSETANTSYVNNYISIAAEISMLINSGKYPVEYEIEDNQFVYTDITTEQMIYFAIAVAVILLIICVIFIIKYKTNGLVASVSCVGFISILLLLLRYTNVNISIEGIGAIILTLIINLKVNQIMLSQTKGIDYKNLVLKFVPIIIITLVFCFAGWSNLNSFGMIMFWGLALIAVYNIVVTKTLLKLKESK